MVMSICCFVGRQAIFAGDRWKKVLAEFPVESIMNKLATKWERKSDASTSSEKWAQLEGAILEFIKPPGGANGESRAVVCGSGI
jgi:hypothetical protein